MNRKRKLFYVFSHVLLMVWMLIIYSFSAQNGESSGGLSGRLCLSVITFVNDLFHVGWGEVELMQIADAMGYPIRKLAHMTEFGILAMLFYGAIGFYPQIQRAWRGLQAGMFRYILAFVLTVCYAALDEFHQLFIPERSGNLFDVCVDSAGACLALCFLWQVQCFIKNR